MIKKSKKIDRNSIRIGHHYRIISINTTCRCHCRHKLLAMGLIPDSVFHVVRKAPLGDPIEIEIKGFLLSLRARELAILELKEVV